MSLFINTNLLQVYALYTRGPFSLTHGPLTTSLTTHPFINQCNNH